MSTQNNATEADIQLYALDMLASMTYQTKFNVETLEKKAIRLPPSPLKDIVIIFVENQRSWVNKLLRGMKKIGIDKSMENDLNSEELPLYSIVCEYARQTRDLHAAANLMEYISAAQEIPIEIQEQIVAILKPLKKS